jgi:hypothetical protein
LPPPTFRRTSTSDSDLLGDDCDGDALTVISLVLVVKQFESGGLRLGPVDMHIAPPFFCLGLLNLNALVYSRKHYSNALFLLGCI